MLGGYYNGAPTWCYSKTSSQILKSKCSMKQSCRINGRPDFTETFDNSCTGYSRILVVQYKCIKNLKTQNKNEMLIKNIHYNNYYQFINNQQETINLPFCSKIPTTIEKNSTDCLIERTPVIYAKYLSSLKTTNFNYPIYQQIICEHGSIVLKCPKKLAIHIYLAYYGIQPLTFISSTCNRKEIKQEIPTMCSFIDYTYNLLKLKCEQKETCFIKVDNNNLGDICSAYNKQLFIQYQCLNPIDLISINVNCDKDYSLIEQKPICPKLTNQLTDINERVWCDGESMLIQCPINKLISIQCSFYGTTPYNEICYKNNTKQNDLIICYFKEPLELIYKCNNKNVCLINGRPNFLYELNINQPCNMNSINTLFVQWKCY